MAQANSNAQREPTMEEILASIRRIIEDSDAEGASTSNNARPSAGTAANEEPEALAPNSDDAAEQNVLSDMEEDRSDTKEDSGAAVTSDMDAADDELDATDESHGDGGARTEDPEVRSFKEELSDDIDASAEEEDDLTMSALSLADIQAEVAMQADPAQHDEDQHRSSSDALAEDDVLADEDDRDRNLADDDDASLDASGVFEELLASTAGGAVLSGFERGSDADDRGSMAYDRHDTEGAADVTNMAVGNQAASSRAPIISEQAGRQVAAAFDELSEAFSKTRTKTFDEMAEEMMRPMLQDWLDNNLPVLVEKLVREEIDRVARGASR